MDLTALQVCAPFNVRIAPATGKAQYGLSVDADSQVAQSITTNVDGGVLTLSTVNQGGPSSQTFSTQNPIKVTVRWDTLCCKHASSQATWFCNLAPVSSHSVTACCPQSMGLPPYSLGCRISWALQHVRCPPCVPLQTFIESRAIKWCFWQPPG